MPATLFGPGSLLLTGGGATFGFDMSGSPASLLFSGPVGRLFLQGSNPAAASLTSALPPLAAPGFAPPTLPGGNSASILQGFLTRSSLFGASGIAAGATPIGQQSLASSGGTAGTLSLGGAFRDNAFGNRTPLVVGLTSGGIGNLTPSLGIFFLQNSANLIAPFNAVPGAGATFGVAFL